MKNFLRALRHSFPYRRRLAISIFCAMCAATFGPNAESLSSAGRQNDLGRMSSPVREVGSRLLRR